MKLQRQLDILAQRLRRETVGRVCPTPKAIRIRKEMAAIKEQMGALDRDAASRLALEKAPIDDVLEVIALPLLADVMNDLVAGVDGMLRRNGAQETIFSEYTAQIRKSTMAIVDTLRDTEEALPKLLDCDDTLVDAVRKKLMSFIRQHLNIKK